MARAVATGISALTDDLLTTHILSNISFRDVVRSSLVSHRWRYLWKKLPFVIFCCQDFENQTDNKIEAIIEKALLHHDGRLCCLDVEIAMDDPKTANINNWIRLAAEKKVERMHLYISYRDPERRLDASSVVELGDSVFSCENLTAIIAKFINLPQILTDLGAFRFLKTLYCDAIFNMDDAMFEGFMALCPHLQNLGIRGCLGLKHLNIRFPNLKYLDLGILSRDTSLQVACPLLTEICLMDYEQYQGLRLLQGISSSESVTIINLQNYTRGNAINPGLPSISVLNGFPRLELLKIHGPCFKDMISDEISIAELTLPNLKMVHAHIGQYKGGQSVKFLGFLLRNCPLTVIRILLTKDCHGIIQNKFLDLKKEFPKSRLSIDTRRRPMKWDELCQSCDKYIEYL
ncbi:putative FBD-associated F-box protein At5g56440 [Cryptomeria japonica]|uniref:putative FBD-associated F-box protein At5g56440 n=1 Tax=Cryptomeria japonica TaxID=3369 RepID=UPI0027D9F88A|nr:putative FBD-associated F-box protein At5g56440 [Cryptomeria japonica]